MRRAQFKDLCGIKFSMRFVNIQQTRIRLHKIQMPGLLLEMKILDHVIYLFTRLPYYKESPDNGLQGRLGVILEDQPTGVVI